MKGETRITLMIVMITVSSLFPGLWAGQADGAGFRVGARLEDAHWSFLGENAGDYSGYAVASASDVNGDGFCDLLISAPYNSEVGAYAGEVYLILGKVKGFQLDEDLGQASASFRGESTSDMAGLSIGGGGDVNGDGFCDLVIGAPFHDGNGVDSGAVYLVLGKSSGWALDVNLSQADASFLGEDSDDYAGYSVDIAGDVDRDGYDDIIIGAYNDEGGGGGAGKVYLVFGRASGWSARMNLSSCAGSSFLGEAFGDGLGICVSKAGDVNWDGFGDVLISAPWNSEAGISTGQVYIVMGASTGWTNNGSISGADASFFGEGAYEDFGMVVTGGGDVDGDGFADIAISAPSNSESATGAGQVYLVLGRESPWEMDMSISGADASFLGSAMGDGAGYAISIDGDLDGDGLDDIMIGAPSYDDGSSTDAGHSCVVLGREEGWSRDRSLSNSDSSFIGEMIGDLAGSSVEIAEDLNGDGCDDAVVGACPRTENQPYEGQTYVVFYESMPSPPEPIKVGLSTDGASIGISWLKPGYWRDIAGYRIYRSMSGSDPLSIGEVGPSSTSFFDVNVGIGATYWYYISTIDVTGRESRLSPGIMVKNDMDCDGDNVGDPSDWDDDGDSVPDESDAFPRNANESIDSDCDGTGNNLDMDDDNDGAPDLIDPWPLSDVNEMGKTIDLILEDLKVANYTSLNETLGRVLEQLALARQGIGGLTDDILESEGNITDAIADAKTRVISSIEGMNASVLGLLVGTMERISDIMDGMNRSVKGMLQGIWDSMNSSFLLLDQDVQAAFEDTYYRLQLDLLYMERSLRELDENMWEDMNMSLIALDGDIDEVSRSISENISIRFDQLELYIEIANFTLHNHLTLVEAQLTSMRSELTAILYGVLDALGSARENASADREEVLRAVGRTEEMLRTINETKVPQMEGMIDELAEYLRAVNDSEVKRHYEDMMQFKGYCGAMNDSLNEEFDGIRTELAMLSVLDDIRSDVVSLGGMVKEVEADQEDSSDMVSTTSIMLLAALVMLFIQTVLILLLVVRFDKLLTPASNPPPAEGPEMADVPVEPEAPDMPEDVEELEDIEDLDDVEDEVPPSPPPRKRRARS